jgi:hypothetical protein
VVFLHPNKPAIPIIDGLPGPLIDYPFDTTRTAVHMVVEGRLSTRSRPSRMEPLRFHEIDLMAGGFASWFSGGSRTPVEHHRVDRDSILCNSAPVRRRSPRPLSYLAHLLIISDYVRSERNSPVLQRISCTDNDGILDRVRISLATLNPSSRGGRRAHTIPPPPASGGVESASARTASK